ncbi:unnamed protein product [Musa hybrid cultivar]
MEEEVLQKIDRLNDAAFVRRHGSTRHLTKFIIDLKLVGEEEAAPATGGLLTRCRAEDR